MGRKRTKPISKGPKESLLQRICQNPGLGYKSMDQPLLEELESEGAIFQHCFPWSETVFWYEAGYPVDKLFQPDQRHGHPVKHYIDPTYKGSWQPDDKPLRKSINDIPIDTDWKPAMQPNINPHTGERQTMSTSETPQDDIDRYRQKETKANDGSRNPNLSKILTAIAAAEKQAIADGTYKLPTRNELSLRVELKNYFYSATPAGEAAQQAYTNAQERLLQALQVKKGTAAPKSMSEAEAEAAIDAVQAELDAYDRDQQVREAEAETDELLNNAGRNALKEAQWQAKMSAACVVELTAETDRLKQELQQLGDRLNKFEQLEQSLQEAEQRNYELRQQLQAQQGNIPTLPTPMVQKGLPLQFLRQELQHWSQAVDRLESEREELEKDLLAAKGNHDCYQHLVKLHAEEAGTEGVTIERTAPLNGHTLQPV